MRKIILSASALLMGAPLPAHAEVDQIVVTASPLVGPADRFASIVSKVSRDQILENGGANLSDALKNVPGVTGTGFAAGASRPVIRGFDANRVRLLEDGVGSFYVSDVGPDHGVPIDPLSAQSIEVVRGAATLRYGSQAIGGVVNVINNRVPLKLPEKPISSEFTGSYGTVANTKQGSGMIDAGAGQLAFHADGFIRRSGDYDTPVGVMPNSFFRGDGFSAGTSYFFGDGDKSRVGGAVVHYDAKYGIPGEVSFIDMKQTKGLFKSSIDVGAGPFKTFNIDGGYADYKHSEIVPGAGAAATFIDKEWDSRGEAVFDAFGPFSGAALGVQIQGRKFSALGAGADYLLPTDTKSEAGFGFAEIPVVERVKLQVGARVERVSVQGTPTTGILTKRAFTPISGAVGVVWDVIDPLTLGLTLSSTARAPGQTELFARGPHDGPSTFETGDSTLKIERANSAEGTMRLHVGRVRIENAIWATSFRNYIYGRVTGQTCDDTGICVPGNSLDLKELFYEQRDARFWGMESKAEINLYTTKKGGALTALVLADRVRARLDDHTNVPRIPPYHVGGGLAYQSELFDIGTQMTYAGRQDHVAAVVEDPTKGYVELDANMAVRPFTNQRNIEFAVVGHNLTDDVQRNHVALNKDDVIMPGRDVRFMVRVAF